jgi:hypothetical protein
VTDRGCSQLARGRLRVLVWGAGGDGRGCVSLPRRPLQLRHHLINLALLCPRPSCAREVPLYVTKSGNLMDPCTYEGDGSDRPGCSVYKKLVETFDEVGPCGWVGVWWGGGEREGWGSGCSFTTACEAPGVRVASGAGIPSKLGRAGCGHFPPARGATQPQPAACRPTAATAPPSLWGCTSLG